VDRSPEIDKLDGEFDHLLTDNAFGRRKKTTSSRWSPNVSQAKIGSPQARASPQPKISGLSLPRSPYELQARPGSSRAQPRAQVQPDISGLSVPSGPSGAGWFSAEDNESAASAPQGRPRSPTLEREGTSKPRQQQGKAEIRRGGAGAGFNAHRRTIPQSARGNDDRDSRGSGVRRGDRSAAVKRTGSTSKRTSERRSPVNPAAKAKST
jgi:hypothetical protein